MHLAAIAGFGALSLWGAAEGGWISTGFAIFVGAVNATINIPPIIVQRYNRLRAYRLLDKLD